MLNTSYSNSLSLKGLYGYYLPLAVEVMPQDSPGYIVHSPPERVTPPPGDGKMKYPRKYLCQFLYYIISPNSPQAIAGASLDTLSASIASIPYNMFGILSRSIASLGAEPFCNCHILCSPLLKMRFQHLVLEFQGYDRIYSAIGQPLKRRHSLWRTVFKTVPLYINYLKASSLLK